MDANLRKKIDDLAVKIYNTKDPEAASLPMPHWVGDNFDRGILFIGTNPGIPQKSHSEEGTIIHTKQFDLATWYKFYLKGLQSCIVGMFISKVLQELNLTWDDISVTNIVKVATPNNNEPTDKQVKLWLPFLHQQIILLAPRLVVTFGYFAKNKLIGSEHKINEVRTINRFFGFNYLSFKWLGILHPSYMNRQGSVDYWLPRIVSKIKEGIA